VCSRLYDGTYRFGSEATRSRIRVITAQLLGLASANIWIYIVLFYLKSSGMPHWGTSWIVLLVLVLCGEYYCYRKVKQLVSDFAKPTTSVSQHA
jgi:hypothetical protein